MARSSCLLITPTTSQTHLNPSSLHQVQVSHPCLQGFTWFLPSSACLHSSNSASLHNGFQFTSKYDLRWCWWYKVLNSLGPSYLRHNLLSFSPLSLLKFASVLLLLIHRIKAGRINNITFSAESTPLIGPPEFETGKPSGTKLVTLTWFSLGLILVMLGDITNNLTLNISLEAVRSLRLSCAIFFRLCTQAPTCCVYRL